MPCHGLEKQLLIHEAVTKPAPLSLQTVWNYILAAFGVRVIGLLSALSVAMAPSGVSAMTEGVACITAKGSSLDNTPQVTQPAERPRAEYGGWVADIDRLTGKVYYVNHETREWSETPPEAAPHEEQRKAQASAHNPAKEITVAGLP